MANKVSLHKGGGYGHPLGDPRDDYGLCCGAKAQATGSRQDGPNRARDQRISPQKEVERDDRSPIQRRLESLAQRAADRRIISPKHPARKRTVLYEQPQEKPRHERHHTRDVEARIGRDRLPPIAVDLRLRPESFAPLAK